MLAGTQNISQSMFGAMGPEVGPSVAELEAERERILYRKQVKITDHHVRIFDMHVSKERLAYEKLMKQLIVGTQARTHVIWSNDRQLLTNGTRQGWQRYLEWTEYELEEEATPPVGVDTR